jgi:hypothetical protein
MSESLSDISRFDPVEVLNCLLSAAKLPHARVIFLIPRILTALLIRSPEVLHTHLWQILEFTLLMMSIDGWEQDTSCKHYRKTVLNEADVTDTIETIVQISVRTGRLLPYEALIAKIFKRQDELVLPHSVVSKLTGWLIQRDSLDLEAAALLSKLCERETEKVRKYAVRQSVQVQQHVLTYLRPYLSQLASPRSVRRKPRPVVTGNSHRIMIFMEREVKLGKRCNFPSFLAACAAYPKRLPPAFILQIIDLVGNLPECVIVENQDDFDHMCLAVFDAPEILNFLKDEWVAPEKLVGLGRIVWSSPATLLQGSEAWLSRLYPMFLNSIGRTRHEIVKVFKAIEEVTGACVTDLPVVKEPYSSMIQRMIKELSVDV